MKILQIMSAWNSQAKFLKEGLEIFLGSLLTMKANRAAACLSVLVPRPD